MNISIDLSDASQVTVLVEDEEEDEVKPIISVDSIKRVVSMSQSFTGSQGSQTQGEFSSIISVDSIKRVVSMNQSFTDSQGSQPQGEFSSILHKLHHYICKL